MLGGDKSRGEMMLSRSCELIFCWGEGEVVMIKIRYFTEITVCQERRQGCCAVGLIAT